MRGKRGQSEPGSGQDDRTPSPTRAMTNKKQKTTASTDHRVPGRPFAPLTLPAIPHPAEMGADGFRPSHVAYEAGCGDSPDSCRSLEDLDTETDTLAGCGRFFPDEQLDGSEECDMSDLTKPADLPDWLHMFQMWTNTERMAALESLVTNGSCDGQQIRFLLSLIEPQLQRDFVSLLPKELALYVLSFLEPKDLLQAAQTCRYWRILCEDNLLWREKCKEEGLLQDQETVVDLFRKRASKGRCKSLQSHSGGSSASGSSAATCEDVEPVLSSQYKLGFLRQKSIEYNWRYGRFPADPESGASGASSPPAGRKGRYLRPIQQLKGHDDHVITCLQFNPTSK